MTTELQTMALTLKITFDTPVNIGGYGAPTFVDRPFRRDREGWPFIPATTLKGRLRHECERLAQLLGVHSCYSSNPQNLCHGAGAPCVGCRIFGSAWVTGRLYPTDLMLIPPLKTKQAPLSETRFNVSISRQRQVAEDARLFTTELFLPGIPLVFTGRWEARLSLEELVLVEAGLGTITSLGRGKTGGLGWCTIQVQSEIGEKEGWRAVSEAERAGGRLAWEKQG